MKAVWQKNSKKGEYISSLKSEIALGLKKLIFHALQPFSAGFQHLEEKFVMYKMFSAYSSNGIGRKV